MSNLDIYNKVRSVPKEALKEIKAGRLKGFSDINPMWRIKTLTEIFGMCGVGWKTEIVDKRIEEGGKGEKACFIEINLYVKVDGVWSDAIVGLGGSSFIALERNGLYTSDECFKMAYTDALGIACKSLGVAADVYFDKDRTKYDDHEQTEVQGNAKQTSNKQQNKVDDEAEYKKFYAEAKGKWGILAGNTDGFDDFVEEQKKKNYNIKQVNAYLARKILEKQGEN